jgi:Ca-activated chloride channel family protein
LVDRSASLSLGDFEASAPPALLLELLAPPKSMSGAYRLAQLLLAYDDPAGGLARQTIRQDVVVNYFAGSSSEPPNPHVMKVVERVTAFKLQTRALEDAQRGDIPGATRKLQAAATRLLDMGETDLAQVVQEQAQQLAQQGQISPETAKAARYKTRKLTQKLD